MDPARLLRFRRPRLRAGDATLLRAGTSLGQRRGDRQLGFPLRVLDALLAALFAPACLACTGLIDSPLSGPVCPACWQSIPPLREPLCERCGEPLLEDGDACCERCRQRPPAFSRCRAAGAYEATLRTAVHALKYDGRRSLARPLAALMEAHAGAVLTGAHGLVPVPLHSARRRTRGFNQSADLAANLGLPVYPLLERVRATHPQADLPETERQANVQAAFAVARRAPSCAGAVLVLVDDVSTTGATLDACARVLRAAGAADVRAITAARAVRRRR